MNLCIVKRPTQEELELQNDPEPLDDEEQIEREREEEERLNLEAARRIQAELNGGRGDFITISDDDEGNIYVTLA